MEGVHLRILSLLFVDDVDLLALLCHDLQHSLNQFSAKFEVAEMRTSTSRSWVSVLSGEKMVDCPLRIDSKVLPQVDEFKCLNFEFWSHVRGKMVHEININIQTGAASPVLHTLCSSIMVEEI